MEFNNKVEDLWVQKPLKRNFFDFFLNSEALKRSKFLVSAKSLLFISNWQDPAENDKKKFSNLKTSHYAFLS